MDKKVLPLDPAGGRRGSAPRPPFRLALRALAMVRRPPLANPGPANVDNVTVHLSNGITAWLSASRSVVKQCGQLSDVSALLLPVLSMLSSVVLSSSRGRFDATPSSSSSSSSSMSVSSAATSVVLHDDGTSVSYRTQTSSNCQNYNTITV